MEWLWGVGVSEGRKLKYVVVKVVCDGILSKIEVLSDFWEVAKRLNLDSEV